MKTLTGIDPYRSSGRQKDGFLGVLESVVVAELNVAAIARKHAVKVCADRTDHFRLRVRVALDTAATSRVWSGRDVRKRRADLNARAGSIICPTIVPGFGHFLLSI